MGLISRVSSRTYRKKCLFFEDATKIRSNRHHDRQTPNRRRRSSPNRYFGPKSRTTRSFPKKDRGRYLQKHQRMERLESHRQIDHPKPTGSSFRRSIRFFFDHQSFERTTKGPKEGQEHQTRR